MGNKYAKMLAGILVAGELLLSGGVVFAQTTTEDATPPIEEIIDNTVPLDETPVPDTEEGSESADLQGASSTPQLQETFSDQETIDPSDTSADDAVELATTTDEVLPPEEEDATDVGTTTDEVSPPPEETLPPEEEAPPAEEEQPPVEPENVEVIPPVEDPIPAVENTDPPQVEVQVQAPITISREELRPNPKYSFTINTSKRISTNRRVRREHTERGRVVVESTNETLSAPPEISVDNSSGLMRVSGSCSDRYYVILVYNNETDYASNRNLYVVNRAFLCEGGSYSYDLVNLPPTLPDGTYYLLVGGMGEDTPWQPITSLTEIELHRNH